MPAPHHWNQALLLEVPADIDPGAFDRAFAGLVRHHDAFRLRFARHGQTWTQTYAATIDDVAVETIDLSALADAGRAGALEQHAARAQASLDLTSGPLVRAVHFSFGPRLPGRLLLFAHHLVVDGVSWRVLLDDLQLAYEQARRRDAMVLPARDGDVPGLDRAPDGTRRVRPRARQRGVLAADGSHQDRAAAPRRSAR